METAGFETHSQADGYNSAEHTSASLAKFREALEAYNGLCYPLANFYAKFPPPEGLTEGQKVPLTAEALADSQTFRSGLEHVRQFYLAHQDQKLKHGSISQEQHTKKHTKMSNYVNTWESLVFGTHEYALCAYPTINLAVLDIDEPELVTQIEQHHNIPTGYLEDLLNIAPAIIHQPERGLQGHIYLTLSQQPAQRKQEIHALTKLMGTRHQQGGETVILGQLILNPEEQGGSGNYQKIHGGYRNKTGEILEGHRYRLVDSYGVEQPYSYIHEAPQVPSWLLDAIPLPPPIKTVEASITKTATKAPVGDSNEPSATETLAEYVDKLYTNQQLIDELEKRIPASCSINRSYDPPRIESSTQETNVPGGLININHSNPGQSNIKFYSENVKHQFVDTTYTPDTLRLSTIALLPSNQWSQSNTAANIHAMLNKLEHKLGYSKAVAQHSAARGTNKGVGNHTREHLLESLKPSHKAMEEELESGACKKIATTRRMTSILAEQGTPLPENEKDYSDTIVTALRVHLASEDVHILDNKVRNKGTLIYDPKEQAAAIGASVKSPQIRKTIIGNIELFRAAGWEQFKHSTGKPAGGDYLAHQNQLREHGWWDMSTGKGATTLALEDITPRENQKGTNGYYTPKKTGGLQEIVKPGTITHIVSSGSTHRRFHRVNGNLNPDDFYRRAARLLGMFTRLGDGYSTVAYCSKTHSFKPHPNMVHSSPMPQLDAFGRRVRFR